MHGCNIAALHSLIRDIKVLIQFMWVLVDTMQAMTHHLLISSSGYNCTPCRTMNNSHMDKDDITVI